LHGGPLFALCAEPCFSTTVGEPRPHSVSTRQRPPPMSIVRVASLT
jgi:hypothetical protein